MLQDSKQIQVMARRWDSTRTRFIPVAPGATLESIVLDTIQGMRREGQYSRTQARLLLRYARCRVDGVEIKRSLWATTCPHEGARIEVLQGVKGGGGGGGSKNPVATVLSIVIIAAATIATFWAGGTGGLAAATAMGITQGALTMGIGIAATGLLMAVNALFPASTPSLSLGDASSNASTTSQTYSITGAKNSANPRGYIPLICGKHRHTPPLGGKSWTVWEGDKQYFNMLVVWGHPGIEVTDFRISDTPLSDFKNVDHKFHQSTTGDDLIYFAKSYNQQNVGATITNASGWTSRTIGECEDISLDLGFSGLGTIDQRNGNTDWRTVQFEMQYADADGDNWTNFGGTPYAIREYTSTGGGYSELVEIRANYNGDIAVGMQAVLPVDESAYPISIYPTKDSHVTGCDVTFSGGNVRVSSGTYLNNDYVVASAATTSEVVKNYRVEGLERKNRKVRMRRITGDTDSQYIRDKATWVVARAILNQPAFNTRLPYCVSELRIQASEQLSSYVDDFNALCHSNIPDWDVDTQTWVTRTTSNPASIMRYLLTSEHGLVRPYTTAKLDESALTALWEWCDTNGYEFNFICDAEQTTWARLVQVLAAGRAAPTTDVDGLWGAVIDRSGKEVKQLFTPRNSWGMKVDRGFMDLPHALRVSFVDETDDYATHESFVFSDGYSNDGADGTTKATDIVEWDYPGVTEWEKVWRMGRYHLAKLLHRQMSVTINTDFEWLVCHRGDLVGIASDVLMNTFGTARIQRLVYDVDGIETLVGRDEDIPLDEYGQPLIPIGVQLDDTVIFSEPSPARYGIAVRDRKGAVTSYELVPEYGDEEHATLYFKSAVPAQAIPPLRAICSVSLMGEEYEEYLLASVSPGDNASAELTLIPYAAEEIEAAAEGDVPPYTPPIILDVTRGRNLPTPIVTIIRSDESVLARSSSGGTTPRIAAWWELTTATNDIANLGYQIMATDVETNEQFFGSATSLESYVACSGVTEGRVYAVRVRAISGSTGRTSAWSAPVRHVVIGRTTPPPAPDAVNLDGYTLHITQSNRPLDVVGHVVKMVFDDTDPISYARTLTNPYTTTGTFDLTPWAGRARRVFVQTIDEIGLLSDPVSIAIDLGDTIPDNLLFEYSERDKGWTGEIYGGHVTSEVLYADSTTTAWSATATDAAWSTDAEYPAWNNGDGVQMSYTWIITFPKEYAGGRILVEPVPLAGKLISLEYRHYNDTPAWSAESTDPAWSTTATDPAWDIPVATTWAALPETYTTAGRDTVEFRATYASGEVATLSDIITSIDVPDRDWAVEDLEISAAGTTHIPLPVDTFRAVTNVVATLQYRAGDTAVTTARVPGTEEMGNNGYLELGPILLALDSNRNGAAASADVRIKGY